MLRHQCESVAFGQHFVDFMFLALPGPRRQTGSHHAQRQFSHLPRLMRDPRLQLRHAQRLPVQIFQRAHECIHPAAQRRRADVIIGRRRRAVHFFLMRIEGAAIKDRIV